MTQLVGQRVPFVRNPFAVAVDVIAREGRRRNRITAKVPNAVQAVVVAVEIGRRDVERVSNRFANDRKNDRFRGRVEEGADLRGFGGFGRGGFVG